MKQLLVVAGETSGDMHAARVTKKIKQEVGPLRIIGMGCRELSRIGQQQLVNTDGDSFGLSGAVFSLPSHLKRAHKILEQVENDRPEAALLVDYSGFNMYLARGLRRREIPAVHYIPPTAWTWGKWRAKWLARQQVKVAAIFPREYEIYQNAGAEVEYVGHPLCDEIEGPYDQRRCREQLEGIINNKGGEELKAGEKVLVLLPGSRRSEITEHLDPMLAAARRLQENNYLRPVIAVRAEDTKIVRKQLGKSLAEEVELIGGHTRKVMGGADLGLVASGTATLEAALIGCPQVVLYKTDFMTRVAAKMFLRTDFISLPNIIAGREVVPELVQKDVKDDIIYKKAQELIRDDKAIMKQQQGYRQVRKELGSGGSAAKTARLVIETGGLDYYPEGD